MIIQLQTIFVGLSYTNGVFQPSSLSSNLSFKLLGPTGAPQIANKFRTASSPSVSTAKGVSKEVTTVSAEQSFGMYSKSVAYALHGREHLAGGLRGGCKGGFTASESAVLKLYSSAYLQ